MSTSRNRESAVIEAVARCFSATWEHGKGGSAAAYLTVDGRRVAVEVATSGQRALARHGVTSRPRLRFDRVALGFMGRLKAGLSECVPKGHAIVVTVTAPIRQASNTAAVLEEMIRDGLARRTARVELDDTINGTQVRARLVTDVSGRASKVIGFVHNPDSSHADLLLSLTESLLQQLGAAPGKREARRSAPKRLSPEGSAAKRGGGERWLVLARDDEAAHPDTYQNVYSQIAIPTAFARILLVLPHGHVETLAS